MIIQLSHDAREIKDAVVELLSFEGSTDFNLLGIHDLIQLMSDQDEAVVARAVHRVYLLTQEDRAIATSQEVIEALLHATRYFFKNCYYVFICF